MDENFKSLNQELKSFYGEKIDETSPPSSFVFLRDYVSIQKPCVIKNAQSWPSLKKWNFEYLKKAFQNYSLDFDVTIDGYAGFLFF